MRRAFESPIRMEELLQHAGWLRKLAASLVRDPGRADDLVQDTWLAALRHPPLANASPRRWLERVARNLARSRHRSARARIDHEARIEERTPRPGPEAIAEEVEAQRLLVDAVARLADPARTIVVLRYFRGLDARAIGRELALPPGTVRWKLKAALEELRRELDRRFEGGRKAWCVLLVRALASTTPSTTATPWLAVASVVALGLALWGWRQRSHGAELASGSDDVTLAALTPNESIPRTDSATEEGTAASEHAHGERDPLRLLAAPETRPARGPGLAGTVLVDGIAPTEPIDLDLFLDGFPWKKINTDEHGHFEVPEIGDVQAFTLQPKRYLVEGGSNPSGVTPCADLVVRLRTPPSIRGRVVTSAGEPVAHARGVHRVNAQTSELEYEADSEEFECDADGRFAIALFTQVDRVELELDRANASFTATLLLEVPRVGRARIKTGSFPLGDLDLGDVPLEPVRALAFRTRNERGAPVSGAVARLDDGWLAKPSNPTNADGRGELRCVPDRDVSVRFSALGFADRVLALGPGDEPEVWLEPLGVLELQLEPPANTYDPFPELLVSAHAALFEPSSAPRPSFCMDLDPIQTELGASKGRGQSSSKGSEGLRLTFRFAPDAGGRFVLTGLRPDVPFTVEAVRAARALARRELVLGTAEHQRVTLPYGD